ncbi:MAG: hypothetical protein JSV82_01540 [Planctomycetota bacterium]|nr:MAG: hypothetical protein JSV82_01540 [Planctomycetota bacterium]
MLTSHCGFLIVLAIFIGLYFFNRYAVRNLHKPWAQLLYTSFGPRTDVRYMTREQLFESSCTFFTSGIIITFIGWIIILLLASVYKNKHPNLWLIIGPFLFSSGICFFAAAYLLVRALFRSEDYTAPNCTLVHDNFVSCNHIRKAVERFRPQNWQKQTWQPRRGLVRKRTAFLEIVTRYKDEDYDHDQFEVVDESWRYDNCRICFWKICESDDPQTSMAYTNGQDWLCSECYERFIKIPDLQEVSV